MPHVEHRRPGVHTGSRAEPLAGLCKRLCRLAADLLAADGTATLLQRRSDDTLVPVASWARPGVPPPGPRRGVPRAALAPLLARLDDETVVAPTPEQAAGLGAPPRPLCIALRRDGVLVGLQVAVRRADPFGTAARRMGRLIAETASLALPSHELVAELDRAGRRGEEFVAALSHELRTPVNVIVGYAQMARDGALDPLERTALLERLERSATELAGAVALALEAIPLGAPTTPLALPRRRATGGPVLVPLPSRTVTAIR